MLHVFDDIFFIENNFIIYKSNILFFKITYLKMYSDNYITRWILK